MKHRPVLQVLAMAMGVLLGGSIGTASATSVTSPEGTTYTSTVSLSSEGSTTFTSSFFVTVHCDETTMSGSVGTHEAGKPVSIPLTSLRLIKCTDPVTARKGGTLRIASDGTVTWTGAEWGVHTSVGECIYATSNTKLGTLTNGGKATLHMPSASIPVVGGSFFCPSSSVWEGSFVVDTPSTLYVD